MKTMRTFLVVAILIGAAAYAHAAEGAGTPAAPGQKGGADVKAMKLMEMPLSSLIEEVKGVKEAIEKRKYAAAIASKPPVNQKEIDGLFTLLDDDSTLFEPKTDVVRKSAMESMQKLTNPALGSNFAKRIKHGSLSSRWVAVDMVGRLKNKEAVSDLIKLVDGYGDWKEKAKKREATKIEMGEYMISMAAAVSLGEIEDERAIPVLIKQLGKMEGEEEKALAKFGGKAFPQLLDIVRTYKNREEANAAAGAMRRMTDKGVMETAWKIAKNDKDAARYAALNMLLDNTDNNSSPTSNQVMDYVMANATQSYAMQAQAISVAKKKKNIDYLIKAFQNPQVDHGWRTGAIVMLGELRDPAAVPALEEALKNSDSEIRELAAISLKQITGKDYGVNWP